MTTFTVTTPSGEVRRGLAAAEVGRLILAEKYDGWHAVRQHNGSWVLMVRKATGEEATHVSAAGANEEEANQAILEAFIGDAILTDGYSIEPEDA